MFNAVVMKSMKKEMGKAQVKRETKACLRSMCRRFASGLTGMAVPDRIEWLMMIGLKESYLSDISSVLAEMRYDLSRKL